MRRATLSRLPILAPLLAVILLLGAFRTGTPHAASLNAVASPSPTPATGWIAPDGAPAALILRYWGPERQPGPYSAPNLIPPLQLWADGRIVWLASETPYYERVMMEGRLPPDVMQTLLQQVIASGFGTWDTRYAEAAPLPVTYLVIDLPDAAPKQVAVSTQGPPGFQALLETILALPEQAVDVRGYVPERAYLWLHGPLLAEYNPDPAELERLAVDVDAEAAAVGVEIEGETLRDLWARVNNAPANPINVAVEGRVYFVTLAIPGVSLCMDTPDPAFDVRWICPALPAAG
jgi:hypothetical protein